MSQRHRQDPTSSFRHDLEEGYVDPFLRNAQSAEYLSTELAHFANCRGNDGPNAFNRLQKLALDRYHTDPIFKITDQRASIDNILQAYFEIFDEFFFFGSLGSNCVLTIGVVTESVPDHCTEGKIEEFVDDRDGWKQLRMTLFRENWRRDPQKRSMKYLGYMLHLMLHAFYRLWMCKANACCNVWRNAGKYGHGVAWLDVSLQIRRAVMDERVFNLELLVHRCRGLGYEVWMLESHPPLTDLQEMFDLNRDMVLEWERKYMHAAKRRLESGAKGKQLKQLFAWRE